MKFDQLNQQNIMGSECNLSLTYQTKYNNQKETEMEMNRWRWKGDGITISFDRFAVNADSEKEVQYKDK